MGAYRRLFCLLQIKQKPNVSYQIEADTVKYSK